VRARACHPKQWRPQSPGTRPADIKRKLEALLKKGNDLALVDNLLVIRPVRHIVRGVAVDECNDHFRLSGKRGAPQFSINLTAIPRLLGIKLISATGADAPR